MNDLSEYTDEELAGIAGAAAVPDEELQAIADQAPASDSLGGSLNIAGFDTGIPLPQGIESALVGAGKTLTDLSRGAQKLYYGAIGDDTALADLKAKATEEQGWYDKLAQENPWSTMAGEMLPYLATAPLSGGLTTQAMIGAGMEGMRYGENQGANAISGGAWSVGGYGAGRMAPRIMGAIRGASQSNKQALKALSQGQQRLVNRADELGYQLKPGQRLQSKPLQQIERSAESMPFTSGLTEGMEKSNQELLNKLALESIGEVGTEVRGSHFAAAADRIGAVYDNVAKNVKSVDLKADRLKNLVDDMSVEGETYFNKYMAKYPNLANARLTGEEFTKLSSKIEKDIRSAYATNPAVADDLIDFKSLLVQSLGESAPSQREALRVAGRQWRNLKALEHGNSVTKGNVNPRTLSSKLSRIDKGGFKRERNLSDYYDTLRIADELGGIAADSQTATRSWLSQIAANPSSVAGGAALRPIYSGYLKSGGSPAYANLLGAYPDVGQGQIGAAAGRSISDIEFPEINK